MTQRIRSCWRLLLGSLITLLGFTACKTTKKTQAEGEQLVLYGPPPPKVERLNPGQEMRLLYGVPPVRIEKAEEPKR